MALTSRAWRNRLRPRGSSQPCRARRPWTGRLCQGWIGPDETGRGWERGHVPMLCPTLRSPITPVPTWTRANTNWWGWHLTVNRAIPTRHL